MTLEINKFDLALSYNSNHWINDIEREKSKRDFINCR